MDQLNENVGCMYRCFTCFTATALGFVIMVVIVALIGG